MSELFFSQQLDLPDNLSDSAARQIILFTTEAVRRRCNFSERFSKFRMEHSEGQVEVKTDLWSYTWAIGLYVNRNEGAVLISYSAGYDNKFMGKVKEIMCGPIGCLLFPITYVLLVPGMIYEKLEESVHHKRESEMNEIVSIFGAAVREGVTKQLGGGSHIPAPPEIDSSGFEEVSL